MSNKSYAQLLSSGLQQMGLELSLQSQQQLIQYVELLAKWSKAYNLTAVRDPDEIVVQHILDSLSVLPFLGKPKLILDVGTGAGLPGVPLAIARPDISFKLLDSQQKKVIFVQHVITSLKLTNISTQQVRVEAMLLEVAPEVIISRAFSSLETYVNSISNLCDSSTTILAMKGRKQQVLSEQLQLPEKFNIVRIESITVPELKAERCLVFLTKQEE